MGCVDYYHAADSYLHRNEALHIQAALCQRPEYLRFRRLSCHFQHHEILMDAVRLHQTGEALLYDSLCLFPVFSVEGDHQAAMAEERLNLPYVAR